MGRDIPLKSSASILDAGYSTILPLPDYPQSPTGRTGEEGHMASDGKFADVDLSIFKELKKLSGEKIRQARKALGLTQLEVATEMGGSLRWYRAIESGDPGIRLEDHLIALLRLGASTAHIALPVLYAGQRMRFPRQLIHGDLASIERTCIEAISDAVIAGLKQDLSPEW
ncbi:helix-turn-helix domain-containing protein [Novosphingobium sp. HII-3]|nr:helix-turn-helix domain-containing protein [Novosphingobium sp. HII-3]